MTAILGFAANDRIVLASDSQMTTPDGIKLAMRKIYSVWFRHTGDVVLVAIAGVVDSAEAFIEIFEGMAAEEKGGSPLYIADCAEAAMKKTREGMIAGLRHSAITKKSLDERVGDRFCRIILGYYHNKEPFIRHLDFNGGRAIRTQQAFLALGSGAPMVGAILSGFDLQSLRQREAIGIAVHAIEAAKAADLHCSGSCQVGYIPKDRNENAQLIGGQSIAAFEGASGKIQKEMRSQLARKIAAHTKNIPIDLDCLD